MAQWSRADRTLYAKLVYYGPAFGGKTTNLQSLHRITDPHGRQKLLSVKTADDRTLFFDLLPFDLGDILGYQVAMKLYTVPGQVRYDTTRQVVLAGADAVIFVADSTASRQEQNVWSLQNLQMNMRAKRLDPARVPILYQFNKQDLPEAAPPAEVASWLGLRSPEQGFPAVAIEGQGVLETFMAACRTTLERIISLAEDRTRLEIDATELGRHLERAFAPHLARQAQGPLPEPDAEAAESSQTPIVLQGTDLLERAVQTGVRLGEKLSAEVGRAGRLEREAEAFRRLSESLRNVGASFDRDRIIDSALAASGEVLQAPAVTLIRQSSAGQSLLERSWGCPDEPLLAFDAGRHLLRRMQSAGGSCVVEDLSAEFPRSDASAHLKSLRAVAAVPVESGVRTLVAYAPEPDGLFREQDVRFLATVAGHLAVGLEKSRLHDELAGHRDRLEEVVTARTEQLREAYEELRSVDRMKDRFLSNLSHEMKTPLTAVLSSALVLRDYKSSVKERKELVDSIVGSAETLQRQLEHLFRVVNLESGAQPLKFSEAAPQQIVREAVQLVGSPPVQEEFLPLPGPVRIDLARLVRAVANLIDNAVKFSPPGSPVEARVAPGWLDSGQGPVDSIVISVLDRGPGVPGEDQQRIFAPFEQGGDLMTAKPRGIGMGLHEARTIARRHGGTLEYSPRAGGGSEFRLTIPLRPASVHDAELLHA